jgi:hypothetical protein
MAMFEYLRRTVKNQNLFREDTKSSLNSGNSYYHSFKKLYFSRLLSKNIEIKICKTIILYVVLYGCETWSLILSKERRLRVFENRVPRRIFGPKSSETSGGWKKLQNEEPDNLYSSPN